MQRGLRTQIWMCVLAAKPASAKTLGEADPIGRAIVSLKDAGSQQERPRFFRAAILPTKPPGCLGVLANGLFDAWDHTRIIGSVTDVVQRPRSARDDRGILSPVAGRNRFSARGALQSVARCRAGGGGVAAGAEVAGI